MRLEGFSVEDILHALAIAPGESAHDRPRCGFRRRTGGLGQISKLEVARATLRAVEMPVAVKIANLPAIV
jgi:hypothetical protein